MDDDHVDHDDLDDDDLDDDERLRVRALELIEISRELKEIFARVSERLGEAPPATPAAAGGKRWAAELVAEHPELGGFSTAGFKNHDGTPRAETWFFTGQRMTDEELLAALGRALASKPDGATSADIAAALWGADGLISERTQIGCQIWGLHRRGLVVRGGHRGSLRVWTLPPEGGTDA